MQATLELHKPLWNPYAYQLLLLTAWFVGNSLCLTPPALSLAVSPAGRHGSLMPNSSLMSRCLCIHFSFYLAFNYFFLPESVPQYGCPVTFTAVQIYFSIYIGMAIIETRFQILLPISTGSRQHVRLWIKRTQENQHQVHALTPVVFKYFEYS